MALDSELSADPLAELALKIEKAAAVRDEQEQSRRNDQASRERQREDARATWGERKKALPGIVDQIDKMLKASGYRGLAITVSDVKHGDIDRVVLEFANGVRDHTKIQISITQSGEFVCAVGQMFDEAEKYRIRMSELSVVHMQHALADAVGRCVDRKRA